MSLEHANIKITQDSVVLMPVSYRLRSKIGLVILRRRWIPKGIRKVGWGNSIAQEWQRSSMAYLSQPSFLWGSAVASQMLSRTEFQAAVAHWSGLALDRKLIRHCRLWTGRDFVPHPGSATYWLSSPGHVTSPRRFSITSLLNRDNDSIFLPELLWGIKWHTYSTRPE